MGSVSSPMQQNRLYYPGLIPKERAVLRAWLKLNEPRFERYLYNFRLGEGVDPGSGYPDYVRREVVLNSRARVDVIGITGERVTLIEIKERAEARQVGQLVAYEVLWRQLIQRGGPPDCDHRLGIDCEIYKTLPRDPAPHLLLVCARIDPDAVFVFERVGARIDIVEPDPRDPDWLSRSPSA